MHHFPPSWISGENPPLSMLHPPLLILFYLTGLHDLLVVLRGRAGDPSSSPRGIAMRRPCLSFFHCLTARLLCGGIRTRVLLTYTQKDSRTTNAQRGMKTLHETVDVKLSPHIRLEALIRREEHLKFSRSWKRRFHNLKVSTLLRKMGTHW